MGRRRQTTAAKATAAVAKYGSRLRRRGTTASEHGESCKGKERRSLREAAARGRSMRVPVDARGPEGGPKSIARAGTEESRTRATAESSTAPLQGAASVARTAESVKRRAPCSPPVGPQLSIGITIRLQSDRRWRRSKNEPFVFALQTFSIGPNMSSKPFLSTRSGVPFLVYALFEEREQPEPILFYEREGCHRGE